jgi:pre-mRNA-processing factor 40
MSSPWQEARAADGKIYYYNAQTKATQWTKPVEMMSPAEVLAVLLDSEDIY